MSSNAVKWYTVSSIFRPTHCLVYIYVSKFCNSAHNSKLVEVKREPIVLNPILISKISMYNVVIKQRNLIQIIEL